MTYKEALSCLDLVIKKARVHLYKPIQIAEILYRDRVHGDIDLRNLETYRTKSRKWRDIVCLNFLGRTSTSSARYQDDLFNDNAVPPEAIAVLGEQNRLNNGSVEKHIYDKFKERYSQMSSALNYSKDNGIEDFKLSEFLDLFWQEAGLRRSIDKIYEIVVYSLFSVIVEELEIQIEVRLNPDRMNVLEEFEDFAKKVLLIDSNNTYYQTTAKINRVGVTNAADRGLDMWANFGAAIQIKHLSLDEKLAEDIVSTVTSDQIVIVCKDAEKLAIGSLFNQIGWRSKVQSIIVESELLDWYERALRGVHKDTMGQKLLDLISAEIINEFPSTEDDDFVEFYKGRAYHMI